MSTIAALQPDDIVRSETGMCDCVVIGVFAQGQMAIIAPIAPDGSYSEVGACAHQTAMLHLVAGPDELKLVGSPR